MLLIEARPNVLQWTLDGTSVSLAKGIVELSSGATDGLAEVFDLAGAEGIGYVLPHGGEAVRQAISRLDGKCLASLETCIPYAPEANSAILLATQFGLQRYPDRAQYLLCETAFFNNLLPAARAYALPYELLARGVRRYGGDGLCHQWAWEQIHARGEASRLISVHLGDAPGVAAIQDGQAVETSLGFAASERIPAENACGDLDPSVTLLLREHGYSVEQAARLLAQESGWQALAGRACGWECLLRGETPTLAAARELVEAALVKEIGAAMAALGGTDALVFSADDPQAALSFIERICRRLEFTGTIFRPAPLRAGDYWALSLPGAPLRVAALSFERHLALTSLVHAWVTEPAKGG